MPAQGMRLVEICPTHVGMNWIRFAPVEGHPAICPAHAGVILAGTRHTEGTTFVKGDSIYAVSIEDIAADQDLVSAFSAEVVWRIMFL